MPQLHITTHAQKVKLDISHKIKAIKNNEIHIYSLINFIRGFPVVSGRWRFLSDAYTLSTPQALDILLNVINYESDRNTRD